MDLLRQGLDLDAVKPDLSPGTLALDKIFSEISRGR
jgi:hypothetical protein